MRFAQIISNGAVFQRNMPIPVWGWCSPCAKVKVDFAGREFATASNRLGYFELRLPPMAEGGPYQLTAQDCISGETCAVEDILVGEVWLASGQSNMRFTLQGEKATQLPQYLEEGGIDDGIRMICIKHPVIGAPEDDIEGQWFRSSVETAADFSAVGAWFALRLRRELGIPIGIINSSYGGTAVHSWLSREATMRLDCARDTVSVADRLLYQRVKWEILPDDLSTFNGGTPPVDYSKYAKKDLGNTGFAAGYASVDFDDSKWEVMRVPGSWKKQNIGGNGAVWLRCSIGIPMALEGQDLELHLGGIDKHDTTYFNGVQIGATGKDLEEQHWNKPRCYRIPATLVKGGRAIIAIRAFSYLFDGALLGKPRDYWIGRKGDSKGISLPEYWVAQMEYEFPPPQEMRDVGIPLDIKNTVPERVHNPHFLFDGMLRPIVPYAIRGAIWYQGESDAYEAQYSDYEEKFAAMIDDWRYVWGQGNFPFYMVQIANYDANNETGWLTVQDAQRRVAAKVKNTGIIPSTDIGEDDDIHPQDKRSFGLRLAALALHGTYGMRSIVPTGPLFKEAVSLDGNELRLDFEWAKGLHNADGDDRDLPGFEVSDWRGKFFHPAKARIEGEAVILSSDKVDYPRHVRYNWQTCPKSRIVNEAGLPMLTFSTSK